MAVGSSFGYIKCSTDGGSNYIIISVGTYCAVRCAADQDGYVKCGSHCA